MNKIFIDCGAHRGESVRLFKMQYPNSCGYRIISFDANPNVKDSFNADDLSDVEFHNVAVWTVDGTVDLHTHRWEVGMTLFKENCRVVSSIAPITVPSIDFSNWILKTFSRDDYIVLKMDIEGAEYDVFEKMFNDGSIDYINKLYVEWHYDYVNDKANAYCPPERHTNVLNELQSRGLKDLYWCAGPGRTEIPEKDVL